MLTFHPKLVYSTCVGGAFFWQEKSVPKRPQHDPPSHPAESELEGTSERPPESATEFGTHHALPRRCQQDLFDAARDVANPTIASDATFDQTHRKRAPGRVRAVKYVAEEEGAGGDVDAPNTPGDELGPNVRRVWNPPNPFDSEHHELLEPAPVAALEIYEDRAKSILSHNNSTDVGFDWSVNPYRGCFHACAYCYARTGHEYLGLGAGTDFDRKIFVKLGAPQLLDRAFRKVSWRRELVAFSGVTDCYQPIEASYQLTRRCLAVCERHENPVAIITKSALVRRDIDVLQEIAQKLGPANAHVSISIPFTDEAMARKIEPGTPSIPRRFETMELLARAGLDVGIMVAPIIPGLNDAQIPELLRRAKEAGAQRADRILLRLPGSVRPVFLARLREEFPLRAGRVEERIKDVRGGKMSEWRMGKRHVGKGTYWKMIDQMWKTNCERWGY